MKHDTIDHVAINLYNTISKGLIETLCIIQTEFHADHVASEISTTLFIIPGLLEMWTF